jgi:glutaredoxin 2
VHTTGEHYKDIPNDLISLISQEDGKKSTRVVIKKASHMVFKSKDILEYITSDGLWVMLYIHDENGEHNEMRVKRYSQIKNWQDRLAVYDHAMLNPVVYKWNDVFKRILRQG